MNSIPGIIDSLPSIDLSSNEKEQFSTFGQKHGNSAKPIDAKTFLRDTFDSFSDAHAEILDQLKEFRDTIGAHSDYEGSRETLPSHAEFEIIYGFVLEFYQLIASSIINVSGVGA